MSVQVSPGACPGESDFHNLTFLFLWTKIEFNKEKRHLIGYHIFAEENIYWSNNSKQETLVPKAFSFELKKEPGKEHNFRVPLIERIGNDF